MRKTPRPSGFRRATAALCVLAIAVLAAGRFAQAQVPDPKPATPPRVSADTPVGNLTARYRMVERFTTKEKPESLGAVGQYQVAFKETSTADDPTREPIVIQAIYSERPAVVSTVSDQTVTDSVRHYQTVAMTPDPWKNRKDRRPLEDLTIWYRERPLEKPEVLVLTPGRELREEEFRFAIDYDFVFKLTFALNDMPVRIGESWRVRPPGAKALVNDEILGGSLSAKVASVTAHPKLAGQQVATIDVTGRLQLQPLENKLPREAALRARLWFAFQPIANPGDEAIIDAPGRIERVSLAQVITIMTPGQTRKPTMKRDLVLERKFPGDEPSLKIEPVPAATPENSWLTFVDRDNRFRFRHPQVLSPRFSSKDRKTVTLLRDRANGDPDLVRIEYRAKDDAQPEEVFRQLIDEWETNGLSVLRNPTEKLSPTEWPGLSVYRMEVALTVADPQNQNEPRRYFDGYVIQFPRSASMFVSATTFQDQPAPFRKQVEGMLKTLKLGTPSGG